MTTENEFFAKKRPWSRIKDEIIGSYLVPYLNKVTKLGHQIVLVDAFAGPGVFEDSTKGSPAVFCDVAEKYVPNNYLGIFVNSSKSSHKKLESVLDNCIRNKKAIIILGSAQDLLKELKNIVGEATLLIYLDPFGLIGCEFQLLEPYLARDKKFSTEIIVNMSMPTIHRLSTYHAIKESKTTGRTKKLNQRLTEVLGGDYWKKIMWSDLSSGEKEKSVIEQYAGLLKKYLPFVGFCPVRGKLDRRVKYYIIFASRHHDALLLMNEIMYKAYYKTLYKIEYKNTLFEKSDDWKKVNKEENITELILEIIRKKPGITRQDLWVEIVRENFMKWTKSLFIDKIRDLVDNKKITFTSSTNRINDDSQLYITPSNSNFLVKEARSKYKIVAPKLYYKNYASNKGIRKKFERVNDGSIIVRFDKTPSPKRLIDVVCPHFVELKWAYGCPYDCSWCYLKGTFRFHPNGKAPVVKDYNKIELHTRTFLEEVETPEILNTGEIADSLMFEHSDKPFSKFIIPMFESQKKHKVLFLTKSSDIKNLLEMPSHNQVIMSFSLNAIPVADKWEKAPKILKRLEAAQKLYDAGFEVRARIDPMVPIENWEKHYIELIDLIFMRFIPERITLGSLRGLQSTINGCTDKSWVKYLTETSNWGKKIDAKIRYEMYSRIISYLKTNYKYKNIGICKETVKMWKMLDMDYKRIKCNCIW